ncbi:hypothetical protein Q3G72_003723 [Acer saccharum]|nr:hypothetical protein Q3G72_003723 [Acer saccharum]
MWGALVTRDQRGVLAVDPTGSTRGGLCMAFGHACLSRTPSCSSTVSWIDKSEPEKEHPEIVDQTFFSIAKLHALALNKADN